MESNHSTLSLIAQWPLWCAIFLVGAASQLARILMGKYSSLTVINIMAGAIGAGIASVTVVSLLISTGRVSDSLAIGISGIVGWLGGNVLAAVASTLEMKIGMKITPTEEVKAPVTKEARDV